VSQPGAGSRLRGAALRRAVVGRTPPSASGPLAGQVATHGLRNHAQAGGACEVGRALIPFGFPWGFRDELPDVEYTVDWSPHMETIQVVFDSKLLRATDQAARRTKLNRSALIRDAVRRHLRRLEIRGLEERDRKGYEIGPRADDELSVWETEATWPLE